MRLVTYNILDGGEGRADPIAEVLLAQRADIIAIVEADNADVLHRLSWRLAMDYVVAAGTQHSVALFSKWAIHDTVNLGATHRAGRRSFLIAELTVPGQSKPLPVGVLHLHPRAGVADEEIRLQQLEVALAAFQPFSERREPHVLMGDFNANSPLQQIDPSKCKASTHRAWVENGNMLPRRAVQMLLDHGYIDTLEAAQPTLAREGGSFTTQQPGQRVDYIFAHGIVSNRIKGGWIEQDRLAKFASDHFPVGCEIE